MKRGQKRSRFSGKVAYNAQKTKQAASQYGYLNLPRGITIFKEEPGKRLDLDILPYEVSDPKHPDRDEEREIATRGELWYKRPFRIHRNIGAANEALVCPSSIRKKCPICEYRATQTKEGADKSETDPLKYSNRNLYVVVPKNHRQYEDKPHIWDISHFLFQDLLTQELEERENCEIFPDLENGLTLSIRFDSQTFGDSKPFAKAARIDFNERDYAYDENVLATIPNLDEVLNVLSYKEIENKFLGLDDEPLPEDEIVESESESEEEDSQPSFTRRKKTAEPEESKQTDEPPWSEPEGEPGPEVGEDEDVCIACEGAGVNSKGRQCRICDGSGRKKSADDTSSYGAETTKKNQETNKNKVVSMQRTRSTKQSDEKKDKSDKCPHGHVFGVDTEDHSECEDCDLWDDCIEAKEQNEKR